MKAKHKTSESGKLWFISWRNCEKYISIRKELQSIKIHEINLASNPCSIVVASIPACHPGSNSIPGNADNYLSFLTKLKKTPISYRIDNLFFHLRPCLLENGQFNIEVCYILCTSTEKNLKSVCMSMTTGLYYSSYHQWAVATCLSYRIIHLRVCVKSVCMIAELLKETVCQIIVFLAPHSFDNFVSKQSS